MRVLVTGATGFIGRHVLAPLEESGFEVHAVARRAGPEGPRWHQADLHDRRATHELIAAVRPTHLLHLAWNAIPGQFWTTAENLRWLESSIALLESFIEQGGKRVVISGTCVEYDTSAAPFLEEVTPLRPATLYGASKHALQTVAREYCRQSGASFAWGRIFHPYGPHEAAARVVPTVIRSLLRNEPVACTSGNQLRDFIYVEDCARAFVALLASEAEGEFNMATGRPMLLSDFLTRLAESMGRGGLLRIGALPHRPEDPLAVFGSASRIRSIGWSELYSLDEGLAATVAWWRDLIADA